MTGGSNCQDKNGNGFCEDRFKWACTDSRYSSWFVPDCQKLCGQCSGSGEFNINFKNPQIRASYSYDFLEII